MNMKTDKEYYVKSNREIDKINITCLTLFTIVIVGTLIKDLFIIF